jgi:hypothetical protein
MARVWFKVSQAFHQGAASEVNSTQVGPNFYGISWLVDPIFMDESGWLRPELRSNSLFSGWYAARLWWSSLAEYIFMVDLFPGWPATKNLSCVELRAGRSVRPLVPCPSEVQKTACQKFERRARCLRYLYTYLACCMWKTFKEQPGGLLASATVPTLRA